MSKPPSVDLSFAPSGGPVSPVWCEPSVVDAVLNGAGNQAGFTAPAGQSGLATTDLAVGIYHELAIDFNLSSLTGGTSPSVNIVTKRKGADGIYYTIDTATALTAVGAISRSLGAGLASNASFGDLIQVSIVITGAPTGAAWTLSIKGKQAI